MAYKISRTAIEGDIYYTIERRVLWGLWWNRVRDENGNSMIFWTEDRAIEYAEKRWK
jgi:hypothetical protein